MVQVLKRCLWLGFLALVCSGAFAADSGIETPDKKPVISIKLGRITYNGQRLPMWAKPAVWEKVLGKASRSDPESGTYTWDELGFYCNTKKAVDRIVQLTIGLVEYPDHPHWPSKPFSGTLFVDGARVTQDSSIREINRHKTFGPRLKEDYLPSIFGYDLGPPNGPLVWLIRNGNVIRNVDVNKYDIPLHVSDTVLDGIISKNADATSPPRAAKQHLPSAPQPAKQTAPITDDDIQRILAEVKDASQRRRVGNYASILSNDADIRRYGMRETRSELIASAREFLYSVSDYQYEQNVENIELAPDGQQATIQLTINERYTERDGKKIKKESSQRWLLERVDGKVMVTELNIQ